MIKPDQILYLGDTRLEESRIRKSECLGRTKTYSKRYYTVCIEAKPRKPSTEIYKEGLSWKTMYIKKACVHRLHFQMEFPQGRVNFSLMRYHPNLSKTRYWNNQYLCEWFICMRDRQPSI